MDINNQKSSEAWWQPAVSLFIRLSAWVAFPVVVATYIGRWLDEKYNSAPFGLVGIVGISFVFSMIGLVYEASKEYRQIANKDKEVDKKKHKINV